jgi:hypothetical protein
MRDMRVPGAVMHACGVPCSHYAPVLAHEHNYNVAMLLFLRGRL